MGEFGQIDKEMIDKWVLEVSRPGDDMIPGFSAKFDTYQEALKALGQIIDIAQHSDDLYNFMIRKTVVFTND